MGSVHYKLVIDDTKPARLRLIDALLTLPVKMRDHYRAFRVIELLVEMEPSVEPRLREALAKSIIQGPTYASPWYFDNGSIRPVYLCPQDELQGHPCAAYQAFIKSGGLGAAIHCSVPRNA